ncbi:hypothetical protein GCM10010168_22390 [Actinoplanes ianthinogenes]|uniref:PIN domain-containing protein n=1 Tax=Actinoplanes ianthinogenes TaxID=122358 RepID=A0ABN6CRL9_9ACTN|nr:hypothetical protein [Actinoplanes ianthinogenes]BCJ47880.1 hypothetical protein Aiant_85370 [Actinoplanes ianthinogenes]GGR04794.1 hypothetical protein GCM10010168_22390 [Actinoplanes ianthinogenes]
MTDEPRTIRLVLDSSAVAGWIRGAIAVGELIAEIDDEFGAVVLPLPCLVQAAHTNGLLDADLIEVLINHPAVFLLADDPQDWLALATMRSLVDSPDRASAAFLALTCGVDVLTRDAGWYRQVGDGTMGHQFDG